MQDHIFIKGARENNLKNIDVTIPRDKLVVLTGLSGSGLWSQNMGARPLRQKKFVGKRFVYEITTTSYA